MITVISQTTMQYNNELEDLYNKFLEYYLHSDYKVNEIFGLINVNPRNNTGKYIRNRLKSDGYNVLNILLANNQFKHYQNFL